MGFYRLAVGGGVEDGFSGDDSGFGGDDGGGERVEDLLLLPFGEHDKSEQGVVGAEHDSATGSGFAVWHFGPSLGMNAPRAMLKAARQHFAQPAVGPWCVLLP